MSAEAPKPNKSAEPHRANIDPTSIRLGNWGDHLLKRLHDSYRREENCDLELILQHDGKSVRVHGSIMHVCTEYFKMQAERQGTPGRVILPETVGTAPLLAIVQFLYTGQLTLNADNFDSICCTATMLGLDVVTNAMGGHGHKSTGLPPSANFNAAGVVDIQRVAAPASRGISGGKTSAVFAGNKRSAPPPDCLVKLEAKRGRAVAGTETTAMKALDWTELQTDNEEAKHDVGKGPLKRLYSKVSKLKRNPNPARSIRRNEETVKQLTSSDVFKKYNDGGSNASLSQDTESSSTTMIMNLIKKNPKLLRDEHPTKLKIKQMSASGQEGRIVIVTVCTKVDLQGKRSIQIVHSPEYDAEPIRADGPWSCTRCLRVGGKILEFSSYQGCRTHMTKVHSVMFDPNSCEQCGEKCPDRTALALHKADRHGIQLPEGAPEKSAANKRPKVKSFSLSDLKRRKFKLKKATVEAEPKAEMGTIVNHRVNNTSAQREEDSSTGGKIENGTESTQQAKNTYLFTTPEKNFALSLNTSQAVVGAANASQSSSIPTTNSHSTHTTVARTTSTALPTFQELRGIPPLPSMANQEPIQVVNLALPVEGGDIHDDDDSPDMGQQPAIFILSNDLDQNQYFDTLFNHQPTELQESIEETLAPQHLGDQLNLQPTVAHEQVTNEFNLHQGQQHFSYASNDFSCTSSNHSSHAFPGFPQHNS